MGEHGNDPIDKVDAGAALTGFQVQRTIFAHIMADIGNMNAKTKQAIVQLFHVNRVVQVFGVF